MYRSLRMSEKVVFVAGAGSGIGAAVAQLLAAEGAEVWCCDRDLAAVERLVRELVASGHQAHARPLDVCREAEWDLLLQEFNRIEVQFHGWVNCAGIAAAQPLLETSLDDWRRVMAVNLDGMFLGTRHGISCLKAKGGSLVNISSVSGKRAVAGAAAYCTSKAGVSMLTRAAAKECRELGLPVRVNAISPGGVKTAMWRSMPMFQELVTETGSEDGAWAQLAGPAPGARFGEASEIAEAVLFLLSPAAAYVQGVDLVMDGGYLL